MRKIYQFITFISILSLFTACSLPEGTSDTLSDIFSAGADAAKDTIDTASGIIGDTIDSVKLPEPKDVVSISADKYVYGTLSKEAQTCYDRILDCMLAFEEETTLSASDEKVLEEAYKAVFADYGGIFWVDGYSYKTYTRKDEVVGVVFSPKYTMTKEEKDAYQAQTDAVAAQWLSGLSADADDFTKSRYVFETLIDHVDYDTASENNQNILSVFLGGATVCQGYADAVSCLLEDLGIPSCIISGRANGEPHAWNLIRLDGEWYFLDATWGNSRYMNADRSPVKHVNYAYLNVTSEELASTHTIGVSFAVPECTATADNYYVHEGLYFDTFDAQGIGQVFADGYYNGRDASSVKMAQPELYAQMLKYFITDGHITDYCNGLRSVTYLQSEETGVLTIEW